MPSRSNRSRSNSPPGSPSLARSPPIAIPDAHPAQHQHQQRTHDAHLAQAFSRARSNTAQSLALPPGPALGSSAGGHSPGSPFRSSPPHHHSPSSSSTGRHGHLLAHGPAGAGRRGSEMDPEELAAVQAEQDALFFGGNSPRAHRQHPRASFPTPIRERGEPSMMSEPAHARSDADATGSGVDGGRNRLAVSPVSPAVNRFYHNQRHGSSSSINSDAAFIDHRSQPHVMASPSARAGQLPTRRTTSGLRGEVGRSPPGGGGGGGGRSRDRAERNVDDDGFEIGDAVLSYPETSSDEDHEHDGDHPHGSPSHRGGPSTRAPHSQPSRTQLRAVEESNLSNSAGTARGVPLDSSILNGSALDEGEGPSPAALTSHSGSGPAHVEGETASNFELDDDADSVARRLAQYPPHIALGSRRPSDSAAVEADVCFPHLQSQDTDVAGVPGEGIYAPPEGMNGVALPGVLPGYPLPFDFNALDDWAKREKESNGIAIDRKGGRHGRPAGISFASEDDVGMGLRRRQRRRGAAATGDEAGDGTGPSRKLSDSTGPMTTGAGVRRQRKLALFEGADADGDTPAASGAQPAASAPADVSRPSGNGSTIVDFKTPLLDKSRRTASMPAYRATSGGGGMNGGLGMGGGLGGDQRPYRFSFYSNALPATIHARSLAEIPAEGQTFEELFVGRRSDTPEYGGRDHVDEHSVPGTGAATPQPGVGGASYNSNVAAAAAGPGGANMSHSGSATGLGGPGSLTTPSVKAIQQQVGQGTGSGKATPVTGQGKMGGIGLAYAQGLGRTATMSMARQTIMRAEEEAEANTWWLDVLCPTDGEMKVLSKVFGIHPLTTEDIQMEETREKIELFRNYYLVCFRSFDQDPYSPTYLEPLNMYIIVFREGTLSFHFRGTPHPQNVRRRIKQLKDYINVTSDWISYALIDDITDAFGPLIQSIEYEVDSVDELVLILKEAEQSDMLRRIGTCRKKVMGLLRLMGNKADVVKGLSKRCNENWSVAPKSDIGLYLSDIQDHLVTMLANLNHYEKILSRSHSNYLAQISIEMTDASNQINDVLSKLTALGSILVPMNLVTGLWGMNVHVPGQDIEEGYAWFISIVCALVGFAVLGGWLTFRFFKWSH